MRKNRGRIVFDSEKMPSTGSTAGQICEKFSDKPSNARHGKCRSFSRKTASRCWLHLTTRFISISPTAPTSRSWRCLRRDRSASTWNLSTGRRICWNAKPPSATRWKSASYLPRQARASQLLRIWTAKEAVLKALGTGLSHPPESVRICFLPARSTASSELPLAGIDSQRLHELDHPALAGHRAVVSAPRSVKRIEIPP